MRKMNILKWVAALALSSNGLFAIPREGLFFGAGGAGAYDQFEYEALNILTRNRGGKSGSRSQGLGWLFLGYGVTWSGPFYVGLEVGTTFPRTTVQIKRQGVTFLDQPFINHMKLHESVYADLTPGLRFFNDFLLYGRAGLSYSNLALSQDQTPVIGPLDFRENRFGWRFGAGINYGITKNLSLGIDYIYSGFPNLLTFRPETFTQHRQKTRRQVLGISLTVNFPCLV